MEYLRGSVIMAAANAYTEVVLQTPTSKTENMAMLIHEIDLRPSKLVAITPASTDTMSVQCTKASKTGFTKISDPDVLARYLTYTHLDAVFNYLAEHGSQLTKFDPPLLYPKSQIYIAVVSSGFDATVDLHARIGYTLEKVSREDFISALVE
ncbi:hypothetical protein ES703_116757 [subsurface metagenome]